MGGKSSSSKVTRYSLDLHAGLCHGPIDALLELRADKKVFWSGRLEDSATLTINRPALFGGDEKEGGLVGYARVLFGEADQPVFSALPILHGSNPPAFRGVTTIYYSGQVSTNSTYLKTWDMLYERTTAGWDNDDPWYPAAARIPVRDGTVIAANPAHMIYEANTDTRWGGKIPRAQLDEASYRAAADLYVAEQFGLCMLWSTQQPVSEFVQTVLDHVGGAQYVSRSTGLLTLSSIRGGYDADDLPLFDFETGLLDITEDQSSTSSGAVNRIEVTWYDVIDATDRMTPAENLASIQATGLVNTQSVEYPGIPDEPLAGRVATRNLIAAAFARKFKVKLDRRGYAIPPAGLFRISAPQYGIQEMVLRAGQIAEQSDGSFQLTALQDVYGLPETTYTSSDGTWTPAVTDPLPPSAQRPYELGWRDLVLRRTAADLDYTPLDAGYAGILARAPASTAADYLVYSRWSGEDYAYRIDAAWCPTLVTGGALQPLDDRVSVTGSLNSVIAGMAAVVGDEVVRIDAIENDEETGDTTLTLGRGCLDTRPVAHAAGAYVWLIDGVDAIGIDTREYAPGDAIDVVARTRGSTDLLDLAAAVPVVVDVQGRQGRPYAPGKVQLNGHYLVAGVPALSGALTLTLAHRNRRTQADLLIDHLADSITPEAGTTYHVALSRGGSVVTSADFSGDNWTYTPEIEAGPFVLQLTTTRDGYEALAIYNATFDWSPST